MKRANECLKADAGYVFAIVRFYRSVFSRLKLSPDDLSILEVGPGSSFGLSAYPRIGAKVVVADRFLATFPNLVAQVRLIFRNVRINPSNEIWIGRIRRREIKMIVPMPTGRGHTIWLKSR